MRLVSIERTGTVSVPLDGAAEVVKEVIESTVALYGRRGYQPPWIGYLAVEADEIVGTCGFAGPPNAGETEIAYFTSREMKAAVSPRGWPENSWS